MILTFLITLFNTFVLTIISLLPLSNGLPATVQNVITSFWTSLTNWSFMLPIDQIFIVLGIAIGFHAIIFLFNTVMFLIRLLRGN